MAGSIKGIIVEIGGDTSGLQKALSKVNSATSSLSRELKGINSLLKLDPKNTELLKQKQDVLNQSISTTEDKLKQLQRLKEEADKKMAEGTEIDEENYRKLQREIINTQNKLSNLKNEASNWNKVSEQLTKWGNNLENIGSKIDSLGNKLTTRLTLPIAGVVGAGIKYNAEIEQMTTAYSTFLGDAKEADKAVTQIKNNAAKTPFDATSLIKANQMLISTEENAEASQKTILALGDAITATGGGNDELIRMASNLQQIKNAGKATAMDIRQFAYAGIDVYGLLADYLGKTTQEVKDMEISYEDLSGALQKASSEGGKYYGAMDKASQTLAGQTKQLKAQFKDMTGELSKSLMPVAKKLVDKASNLIKKFDSLSDTEKENIVRIGLMVAATGPLLKVFGTLTTTTGKVVKGIGTVTKAIGLAKNGIGDATGTTATLAKVFQGLSSPIGLAAIGITTAVGIIIAGIKKAEAETKSKFETMGKAATDFYNELQSAEGYLDSFNSTMFASSQEQQNLQEQMNEIQTAITKICKVASDERREYTQEEITQLEEYFKKLRELKDKEIGVQQAISGAITQQAKTNAETFQGSLNEYKVQSEEWISTARQQAEKTIGMIEQSSIEEIALLNQRYGKKANMQNEAYATEYNNIIEQKEKKIEAANMEVAEISNVYAEGYAKRASQEGDFYEHIQHYNSELEEENKRHANELKKIEDNKYLTAADRARLITEENYQNEQALKKIWKNMYKNMSESEANQLATWITLVSNAELYGGQLSDESQKMVDFVFESFDKMPKRTKKDMQEAMENMMSEMKKSQPTLFSKASSIANGIMSRLKTNFKIDVNSLPGHKSGLDYVPYDNYIARLHKGERVLTAEENKQLMKMEEAAKLKIPDIQSIKNSVANNTKTVLTTPNINFYVQKMDKTNLDMAFDYINRRFGANY